MHIYRPFCKVSRSSVNMRNDIISGSQEQKTKIRGILADIIKQKKTVYLKQIGELVSGFPGTDAENAVHAPIIENDEVSATDQKIEENKKK